MRGYQTDIDGLRAIAILAVVFYHLNPRIFPGGFIGVDVFFVISGYLISKIIITQLDQSNFSVSTFYKRRAARLYPALFFMLACATTATYVISHPIETVFFGKSLIASIFYVANLFYLNEANYFSVDPQLNPLLHTWSLAVEGQFYLTYPLLLIFIYRRCKDQIITILFLIAIGSFFLNIFLSQINPTAAFFLTPSRAFQLLLGGVLAAANLKPDKIIAEISVMAGCLSIIISVFVFSGASHYPGFNVMLPTLGTMLVIYGAQHSIFAKLTLSNPASVIVGKASYSMYLWHWPIIVFYKIAYSPQPKLNEQLMLLLSILIISFLSWRCFELPIRRIAQQTPSKRVMLSVITFSTITLCIACIFIHTDGLRHRFSNERLFYAEYLKNLKPTNKSTRSCFLTSSNHSFKPFNEDQCINIQHNKKNILLLGDSFINRLYYPMTQLLPNASISQVTASGCRPTLNTYGSQYCKNLMQNTFNKYIQEYKFDTVILFAYWKEYDAQQISKTAALLSTFIDQVIVLGPMITYEQALPRLLARFTTHGVESNTFKEARNYQQNLLLDNKFQHNLANSSATYVSLLNLVCPAAHCKTLTKTGDPLQIDYGHLSHEGGKEIIQELINQKNL